MKISETTIPTGGVFRCCLSSVAADLEDVNIGDKAKCKHCKEEFVLAENKKWTPTGRQENELLQTQKR